MASRAEQKAAARAAREAAHRELSAAQTRRLRLYWLGGLAVAVIVAIVIVFVAAGNGGSTKATDYTARSGLSHKAALGYAEQELAGIPQHGTTLGNPNAPVTITEWGDLVCSTCDAFALDSEIQIIDSLVKTGKAKLVYRAYDSASSYANESEFTAGQVAVKAAGEQNKAWDFIELDYLEQPTSIGGKDSEEVAYFTPAYVQSLAQQVPGLNLLKWSAALGSSSLASQVTADNKAGIGLGITGTPGVYVSGPKGASLVQTLSYPTLAQVQQLVTQYS
ncbi:MAG: thioredoxin domain-containing protein [Solirubrobacteraceae bacterium]|jgi:protein-disulfide isomerase